MPVSFERQPEPVVEHPQIAVAAARHGVRPDRLYFLRDHADIGGVAAVVAVSIEANSVGEPAEQRDVVLDADVRAASAAAAATATTAAPAGESASAATTAA